MKDRNGLRYVLSITVCAMALWAAQPCRGLVISEIMYQPADEGEMLEFIEIYNDRAVSEDMGNWAFVSGIGYTFPEDTLLGPKQYLVVARDPAALEAAYGIAGVYGPFTGRLSNDGERVELANETSGIVLSVRYRVEHPWPISPRGTGHSLILSKLGGDPRNASSWVASTSIGGSPGGPDEIQADPEAAPMVTLLDVGHPGRYFKGTREPSPGPAGQPTTDWTGLQFNDNPATTQWLAGPSGYGYSNDSVELQPVRTVLNDMRGSYLSVYTRLRFSLSAEAINAFSQVQATVHYDDAFILYLNGERVGQSDYLPGDPPAFDQPANTASDYAPATVDLTGYLHLLVPGTNVLAIQAHNASVSGSSDFIMSPVLQATIAVTDPADDPDARLLINEVLANSQANPGLDRIELYNPGPVAMDLSHVYLSDNRKELLKYKIPDGVVLAPGEFWTASRGTPPEGFPFGLNSAGETVYLTLATHDAIPQPVRVMDAVRHEPMEPDVSFGRFPDGGDRLSLLAEPTFGRPNSQPVFSDIVINEIMYHHRLDERLEFVELYNRGTTAVSLAGWAFTDGIYYTFDEGVVMEPDSYLVVAQDPEYLQAVHDNLVIGSNLFGPYNGRLHNHSKRIRLSRPPIVLTPGGDNHMVTANELIPASPGTF